MTTRPAQPVPDVLDLLADQLAERVAARLARLTPATPKGPATPEARPGKPAPKTPAERMREVRARRKALRERNGVAQRSATQRNAPVGGKGGSSPSHTHHSKQENGVSSSGDDGYGMEESVAQRNGVEPDRATLRNALRACGCRGKFVDDALSRLAPAGLTVKAIDIVWKSVLDEASSKDIPHSHRIKNPPAVLLFRLHDLLQVPNPVKPKASAAADTPNWQASKVSLLAAIKALKGTP